MSDLHQRGLDVRRLPLVPTAYMAFGGIGRNRTYGTYYVASRGNPRLDFWKTYSDVARVLQNQDEIRLPDGWRCESDATNSEYGEAIYVEMQFSVPHGINFRRGRLKLPRTVLELVSAHLQYGLKFKYEHFRTLKFGIEKGMKFLPLVITPEEYRFNLYHPTQIEVEQCIERFQTVLSQLKAFDSALPQLMQYAYARVLLNEMKPLIRTDSLSDVVERRINESLHAPFARKLRYACTHLAGPKAAIFCGDDRYGIGKEHDTDLDETDE